MPLHSNPSLFLAFTLVAAAAPSLAQDGPQMFRYDAAHSGRASSSPVVVGGMAWRFATGGKVRSTPAIARGLAVFGSEDGLLYAVRLADGREAWKVEVGGPASGSPAIAGERVLFFGSDNVLRALRLDDGSPLWSFATGADVPFPDNPRAFDLFIGSPTVVVGAVYVGSGDGRVYAVELATGKPLWSHATGHRVRSTPAVAEGRVYVGSFDGHVYCLDATTGTEIWKFNSGDAVQSSPAVADGMVFFGSRALAVFGLDAENGRLVWRRPHVGSWVLASPAVAAGKVVIGGSDSHLLEALDAKTGVPIWSVDTGARLLGSPTIAGDVVVYSAEDFRIHVADLETGLGLAWEFTEAAIYSSVALTEGLVLVGSDDNHLYAFRTAPVFSRRDAAAPEMLAAAVGRFAVESGDEFVLSVYKGRLRIDYAHYPPALAVVAADGSFVCPDLFGMSGRIERQPGQPATALALSLFGQALTAKRVD